jgi:hypothetical protein
MIVWLEGDAAAALGLLALGATLPVLFLRRGARPARGWCRACHAPDLWVVFKHTGLSRAFFVSALAASLASIGVVAGSWTSGQPLPGPGWLLSGILALAALGAAALARTFRLRRVRCRTCEAEARSRRRPAAEGGRRPRLG